MKKQKITTDPSKLAGYKKEAFLKAVTGKSGLGYEARKAFQAAYGSKKLEIVKRKTNAGEDRQKMYDEIMSKRNNASHPSSVEDNLSEKKVGHEHAKMLNFSSSSRGLIAADKLFVRAKENTHPFYDAPLVSQKDDDVKERLKKIQG